MKCEEFLDSIDGSENLSNIQKQHMSSCPACKSAFIAATAFTSCRSPLSSDEKIKIATISSAAIGSPEILANSASIAPKTSSLTKALITAIIVLAGSAALLVSNRGNVPQTSIQAPTLNIDNNKEIVIEKKLNHTFTFKNKKPIIKEDNLTIRFSSPCSFVFTPNGLKIISGRANINNINNNKSLTILNGDVSFNIENASIEYTVNNGKVFLKVISGSVRLMNKNMVKYINKGEIWKTPLNNQHKGVIILPTDVEKLE